MGLIILLIVDRYYRLLVGGYCKVVLEKLVVEFLEIFMVFFGEGVLVNIMDIDVEIVIFMVL